MLSEDYRLENLGKSEENNEGNPDDFSQLFFEFNHLEYIISFTSLLEEYGENTEEILNDIFQKEGRNPNFTFRKKSYKIDFDLADTFNNVNGARPFTSPRKIVALQTQFQCGQVKIIQANTIQAFAQSGLGELLLKFLLFHCEKYHAECYYFTASRKGLKKFYDYLVAEYQNVLHFNVSHLDEKGTVYEIRTPYFKSTRIENSTNGTNA